MDSLWQRQEDENEPQIDFIDDECIDPDALAMHSNSVQSVKEHHSRIQMEYYESMRQYNGLEEESIKFPTHTNLVSIEKPGKLKFSALREKPDIDLNQLEYHDQKEFFRLDRAQDSILTQQHEWKTRKTLNQIGKALDANLVKERINMFKQFLTEQKH